MNNIIEEAKSRLKYDPKTGKCFWIKKNKHHPRLTGKEAGSIRNRKNHKRVYIKICGKAYPRSRVAFFIMLGRTPNIVDHIDGNTTNDAWENLRDCSISINTYNSKDHINKSGLPKGVRKMGLKYQARIGFKKRTILLGCFDTKEEAKQKYEDAKLRLHKQYSRGFNKNV